MPDQRGGFAFGGTLFEDHTHPDQAHRHDLAEMAIPKGTVWLWYGVSTAVPSGWSICDGTNGTPDMRGRVPVGVDAGQTEFDVLGEAGGSKTHTLVTGEMPSHSHLQNAHAHNVDSGTSTGGGPASLVRDAAVSLVAGYPATNNTTATNQNTGGGGAHNNLPPYRTLHYIMKT